MNAHSDSSEHPPADRLTFGESGRWILESALEHRRDAIRDDLSSDRRITNWRSLFASLNDASSLRCASHGHHAPSSSRNKLNNCNLNLNFNSFLILLILLIRWVLEFQLEFQLNQNNKHLIPLIRDVSKDVSMIHLRISKLLPVVWPVRYCENPILRLLTLRMIIWYSPMVTSMFILMFTSIFDSHFDSLRPSLRSSLWFSLRPSLSTVTLMLTPMLTSKLTKLLWLCQLLNGRSAGFN